MKAPAPPYWRIQARLSVSWGSPRGNRGFSKVSQLSKSHLQRRSVIPPSGQRRSSPTTRRSGGNYGRSDGRVAASPRLGWHGWGKRGAGNTGDSARGAFGYAGEGRRHAVADGLPRPDRGDPQDRLGDHGRGDQRP